MKFSAVILAGGKSSRMGRDKAFLKIGGQTLLARQIQLVHEAGANEVFISGRADVDYSTFGFQVLVDQFPGAGPLAGIERALASAASPMLLVLAVDLPEMNAELVRSLASVCSHDLGAVPCIGENIEPLAAFYPKTAHVLAGNQLREARNSVSTFARECARTDLVRLLQVTPDQIPCFTNWNWPPEDAS